MHRWAQYGKDLAMINALCELKGWQGAGVAGAYSNWLCKRYKIRMLAENAAVESYNLKLRAKQTQKRIKARNKAKLRRQRFSRLNVGKRGIGGDFNASFPMKNSTRPIWSRRFFSGSSGSKAGFIYPNVRRQNYTITVTEPEFLKWDDRSYVNQFSYTSYCVFCWLVISILLVRFRKVCRKIYLLRNKSLNLLQEARSRRTIS